MKKRELGRTGMRISEIGFGSWAIGSGWGSVDEKDAMAALHRALDLGVNFFDTADVYGDGRSERLLARLRRERTEPFYVATKAGRKLQPHVAEAYTPQAITGFVEDSLKRLETDALDLLQLHCPPTAVYYNPVLFAALDGLVKQGKLKHYGVSVEKVEEALKAIEFPGVETVQIIFNMFRHRPAELFFPEAQRRRIGIIVRVPLASGMLTGKMKPDTAVRPGRPPRLQPRRAVLRQGGDLLRGRLRHRAEGGGGTAGDAAEGRDHGPVRPALDPDVRRGVHGHPRCEEPRPGGGQRRRLRAAPARHDADGGGAAHLRPPHPREGAPALVSGPPPVYTYRQGAGQA